MVLGALGLALVVTATARGVDPAHGGGVAYLNPLVRLPEFVLGIWCALRVRATTRPPLPMWVPLLLCLTLGAVAMGVALPRYPLADYLLLPGIALLIVTAARRDVAGRGSALLRHRASVYLGELSFCFYLVYVLVMGTVLRATGWSQPWGLADGAWRTLIILTSGVAAAMVVHHTVEHPAQAILTRRATQTTTRKLQPSH